MVTLVVLTLQLRKRILWTGFGCCAPRLFDYSPLPLFAFRRFPLLPTAPLLPVASLLPVAQLLPFTSLLPVAYCFLLPRCFLLLLPLLVLPGLDFGSIVVVSRCFLLLPVAFASC